MTPQKSQAVENQEFDSSSDQGEMPGLMKMAGMGLIALAIPIGAGIAVRDIKRTGGKRAILICFSIIVVMAAVGFILIWVGGKIGKRYGRSGGNS